MSKVHYIDKPITEKKRTYKCTNGKLEFVDKVQKQIEIKPKELRSATKELMETYNEIHTVFEKESKE